MKITDVTLSIGAAEPFTLFHMSDSHILSDRECCFVS